MTGRGVVPAASAVIQVRPRLLGCIEERERAAPGRGSAPLLAVGALVFGEHVDRTPTVLALGALAYQAIWVVSITYVVWFALIVRYSASRLSAFTFLTPLFGVAAGHLVLDEPLTAPFALAVALVALGLVLVNRPR